MSLRTTTILVIAVTTLALIGLLLLSLNATLLPHFERQQEQSIYFNLQRVQGVVNSELTHLEQTARDWAKWDDTYAFVQSPSAEFEQANLQDETFIDLNLNLIVFTDLSGQVIYGQYFDLQTGSPQVIPAPLLPQVLNQRLLSTASTLVAQKGILAYGDTPLLVVAHPILRTTGIGPAVGTLILGRFITPAEAARLGNVIQLPFEVSPYTAGSTPYADASPSAIQTSGTGYSVVNLNDQIANGYFILNDIFNNPAYWVKIEQPRNIYKNGALLVNYLFIALFMSALTFGIILYLILEMTVLARMRRLSLEMAAIGSSGELEQRVTVNRNDEISALSRTINGMLGDLEQTQANLRSLSRRVVQVQEEERRGIALELHDEIGQILTGMKLQLQGSQQLSNEELHTRIQREQEMTNELIGRVRQMSLNLRPSMLDDLGLLPTLIWHFERYTNQTNIQVSFQHNNMQGIRFPFDVETAAYRVIQEALTNAARHARVDQVTVRIWHIPGCLGLQIEDDGTGFKPAEMLVNGTSRGLVGMRERAAALRGTLDIDSAPGRGTCITVEIPVEVDNNEH